MIHKRTLELLTVVPGKESAIAENGNPYISFRASAGTFKDALTEALTQVTNTLDVSKTVYFRGLHYSMFDSDNTHCVTLRVTN